MFKCKNCSSTECLQEHHTSYTPEIKQVLCVSCHIQIHSHGVGRPKGYVYTRHGYVQHEKRNPLHYRVRETGGHNSSIKVTIPKEAFIDAVNQYNMTIEEGVKKLRAVWRYGAFDGLYLNFEPIKGGIILP